LRALVATLVVAGAGCRSTARGPAVTADVTFENQGFTTATVYAIGQSGEPYRVGTVDAGRTERLRIPASLVQTGGTVSFMARPLATNRVARSGPITIRAGDSLRITLPSTANVLNVLPGGG
jgi:hypothetical protein